MRGSVPWWAKICAKFVLARLPLSYAMWQRINFFRHGAMDNADYAIQVFNHHAESGGMMDQLRGGTILELGPGDSVATAIIAAAHGARAILVDVGAFACGDVAIYLELSHALEVSGLAPPNLSRCLTVNDVLACCRGTYMTEGLRSLKRVDSESVDLIFSQATLEHMRKREFFEIIKECRRILKPSGSCSHQVDLRDHLGGALNHLRFSERIWELELVSSSGFYTNRLPYSEVLQMFRLAGFDVNVVNVQRWSSLPTPRKRLAKEFRHFQDEDLLVCQFDVVLRLRSG